jgi:hypothetical protein
MLKIAFLGTTALALTTFGGVAFAQTTTPSAPSSQLTEEQKQHGIETFRLIASAMQSQNVPNDVKSALMGCVYENAVGKISDTVDSALAANPGKVDRAKPEQMLAVIAQICGYEAPAAGTTPTPPATPPAARKTPARPSGTAKGR